MGINIIQFALGISLPELAASIAAAKHGETGFVIGNVISSNILNIVAVLGITMLINPISVEFSEVTIQGIFMVILTMGLFFLLKFKGGFQNLMQGYSFLFTFCFFILISNRELESACD